MKKVSKKIILAAALTALLTAGSVARADPVGDFFKRLGDSIKKAGKSDKKPVTRPKKRTAKKSDKNLSTQPQPGQETPAPEAAQPVSPSATPVSIRSASAVSAAKGRRRDLPFGIPVPGKQGFVTSPFAPDAGFVDVRQFPPGTEVNDPYTGKTFLTP